MVTCPYVLTDELINGSKVCEANLDKLDGNDWYWLCVRDSGRFLILETMECCKTLLQFFFDGLVFLAEFVTFVN
eukprot:scaffold65297_cov77-Cyclotella_meneghiniana.AAC.3